MSFALIDSFVQIVLVSRTKVCPNTTNVKIPIARDFYVVRVQGIEPWSRPWQGRILPLNHTRKL